MEKFDKTRREGLLDLHERLLYTVKDLAEANGVARSTVSRALKKAREERLIKPAVNKVAYGSLLLDSECLDILYRFSELGNTKAHLARIYSVSPRTIDRAIKRAKNLTADEARDASAVSVDEEPEYAYSLTLSDEEGFQVFRDDGKSVTIDRESEEFDNAMEILKNAMCIENAAFEIFIHYSVVGMLTNSKFENLTFDEESGAVYVDDVPLPSQISGRLLEAVRSDNSEAFIGLARFAQKIIDNPSYRARGELLEFIRAADLKITDDGMVRAWKFVTHNFKDRWTRKIDNSPGANPKMRRADVCDDPGILCAPGLHVCSKSYIHGQGDRYIEVEVHPKDFVCIPHEYHNNERAKARTCEYTVIREVQLDEI